MANRCGLIIPWLRDEDNSNRGLNTQSPSFWEILQLYFHCPVVAFADVIYGFAYAFFYQGKTHSRVYLYFRLRDSGSLLLKYDTDTIFSNSIPVSSESQICLTFYLVHICLLIISILDLSADLACLSWPVLPCTVISLCFLLLLQFSHHSYPDLTRRTFRMLLRRAGKSKVYPVTHMFPTFLSMTRNNSHISRHKARHI